MSKKAILQPVEGSFDFDAVMAVIENDPLNQDNPPEQNLPEDPPEPIIDEQLPDEPEPIPEEPEPKQENQTGKGEFPSQSGHIPEVTRCDFGKFTANNHQKREFQKEELLKIIHDKGAGLWVDVLGNNRFRIDPDSPANKMEDAKLKKLICSLCNIESVSLFKKSEDEPYILSKDLHTVTDKFSPFENSEFYTIGERVYRTAWKPTPYMQPQTNCIEPVTIKKLIRHLCNDNEVYYRWVLNWIAGHFQTLQKSQVALVLKGSQGSGKGILTEEILIPLFGKAYCAKVDDSRLDSNFKTWIAGRVFYFLNEISNTRRNRRKIKNFLKMLVTDREIDFEAKNENSETAENFGNVLITSNETRVLEVETHDRRYTILQTGEGLKKCGWNIPAALEAIRKELSGFAEYLRTYPVDFDLYNRPLDTPEKQALVEATNDRFTYFVSRLKERTTFIDYFLELKETELKEESNQDDYISNHLDKFRDKLIESVEVGFHGMRFLMDLFKLLNPTEEISPIKLRAQLKTIEPVIFENKHRTKKGYLYKIF